MDNINDIIFVTKVISLDNYNYIFHIDITKTSANILDILRQYNSDNINIIKLNINQYFKYYVIDKNSNKIVKLFKDINFENRYILIKIKFNEKYNNFNIVNLTVFDNFNKNIMIKNKKYNTSSKKIVDKIINKIDYC